MTMKGVQVIVGGIIKYTDENGEVSFNLEKGDHTWVVEKEAYVSQDGSLNVNKDEMVNISLESDEMVDYDKIRMIIREELYIADIINYWRRIVLNNVNFEGVEKWFIGLPYDWWYGPPFDEEGMRKFINDLPNHIGADEPLWELMYLQAKA